jgi:hypothetical protein
MLLRPKKSFFLFSVLCSFFLFGFKVDPTETREGLGLHGARGGLLVAAVTTDLGLGPLLDLEVLLGLYREGEVAAAAQAVDGDGRHRLVARRAVLAALGLVPAALFKDAGLRIGEEELGLAVPARDVLARGLCRLLSVAAVAAADRIAPPVLGEEDLVLSREDERVRAVCTHDVHVVRERSALLAGLGRALVAVRLGRLLCHSLTSCVCSRDLGLHLGFKLGDPLVGPREEVADPLRVFTDGDAVESVVAIRASLEESLLSDERHCEVCWREGGKCTRDRPHWQVQIYFSHKSKKNFLFFFVLVSTPPSNIPYVLYCWINSNKTSP